MRFHVLVGVVCAVSLTATAQASLTIEITQVPDDARLIAVAPFTGEQVGENLGSIIRSNLNHADVFRAIGPEGSDGDAVTPPVVSSSEDWLSAAGLVVRGQVLRQPDGRLSF